MRAFWATFTLVVVPVSGLLVTLNVKLPTLESERPVNVATPPTAATVVVPESEPVPVSIAIVTLPVKPGARAFEPSRASTVRPNVPGTFLFRF